MVPRIAPVDLCAPLSPRPLCWACFWLVPVSFRLPCLVWFVVTGAGLGFRDQDAVVGDLLISHDPCAVLYCAIRSCFAGLRFRDQDALVGDLLTFHDPCAVLLCYPVLSCAMLFLFFFRGTCERKECLRMQVTVVVTELNEYSSSTASRNCFRTHVQYVLMAAPLDANKWPLP